MDNKFRTIVNAKSLPTRLGYNTPALFLGSCFTENIGKILFDRKFPVLINPYGVIYNPLSVGMVLKGISQGKLYGLNDLQYFNELWFSFDHHTSFSSTNHQECLDRINSSQKVAHSFWNATNHLVITFGTARVYYYKKSGLPVANCHKIPAHEFDNKLLSVDEIVGHWSNMLNELLVQKPALKIIFTVSPVRHWKDGPEGNQLSKSTLLLAVNQLVERFSRNIYYFPAYEIMMDDLRDYRFYADDLLHPSNMAIQYIWDKFIQSAIDKNDLPAMKRVEKVIQNSNHKPFNTNTKAFTQFVQSTMEQIADIKSHYPQIDFSKEESMLGSYSSKSEN